MKRSLGNKIRIIPALMALYCALIPLEDILAFSFGGSVNKYIGLLIMGMVVLNSLASPKVIVRISKGIGAFILIVLLSIMWCSHVGGISTISIAINLSAFTLVAMQYSITRQEKNMIFCCIFLGAIMVCSLMLFNSANTFVSAVDAGRLSFSLNGVVADQNNLAVTLSLGFIVGFSMVYKKKNPVFYKTCVIIGMGIIGVSIFLTGSRGGVLSLIAGMVVYILHSDTGIKYRTIIIGTFLIIISVFFIQNYLPAELASRFSIVSVLESGGTGRVQIWAKCLKEYGKGSPFRWILGQGFGTAPYIMTSYYGRARAVHNDFIQVLLELGIVGLISYCIVWYGMIKRAIRSKCSVTLAFLAVILIGSLSIEMLIKKVLWVSFYLALVKCEEPDIVKIQKERIVNEY